MNPITFHLIIWMMTSVHSIEDKDDRLGQSLGHTLPVFVFCYCCRNNRKVGKS